MRLYTFILELRGGTYVSQVPSESLSEAILLWPTTLKPGEIKYFGEKAQSELMVKLREIIPTSIKGMKNVWFLCLSTKVGFLNINIISTSTLDS